MSNEHTPTTDLVRSVYIQHITRHGDIPVRRVIEEFDRWLATVETAAEQRGAEQAWDEGRTAGNAYEADVQKWHRLRSSRFLDDMPEYPDKPRNPYRAGQEGDDD